MARKERRVNRSNRHNESLVSVIVPIYRVEKYLEKCIKSIVNQSHDNLEVILIDDGSPDECAAICDEFERQDKRVRVVHKENGGLSSARNFGLDIATGEYVLFVDSDDYVSSDIVEFLHTQATLSISDIATCGYYSVRDGDSKPLGEDTNNELILDSDAALAAMLYGKNSSLHAWAKLYKRSLFTSIRFPEGKLYEDSGTTYKLVVQADRVSINSARMYYYLRRGGSITGSMFSSSRMDSLDFAEEIYDYVMLRHPSALSAARAYVFSSAVSQIDSMISGDGRQENMNDFLRCSGVVSELKVAIVKDQEAKPRIKVSALLALVDLRMLVAALKLKDVLRTIRSRSLRAHV